MNSPIHLIESNPKRNRIVSSALLARICREEGADDVGFVEVSRPALAVDQEGIHRAFPRTRTLISLAGRMNRDSLRSRSRSVANGEFHHTIQDLTETARRILHRLNAIGIRGVAPSVGFPMDMDRLGDFKIWDVSHKIVAEEAGLGRRGLHRNVIHPKFGNHILLETLLIDAEVDAYDRPIDYNPCLTCNLCVSACPVGAIHKDGAFDFNACMTHNYREFFGGFQDWVETISGSANARAYRDRVEDSETASMWQSLSFGANYKAAYCLAVCPAGEEVYPEFGPRKKEFVEEVVRPLREHPEPVYVQEGFPAEQTALKNPVKKIRHVKNPLRPQSISGFLRGLPMAFNPLAARGMAMAIAFRFTGGEKLEATVVIRDAQLKVTRGSAETADLTVTVDAATWVRIINGKASPAWAVLSGKLKLRGNPLHLLRFQECVPI